MVLWLALLLLGGIGLYHHFWYCRPWHQAQEALADYDFASARTHLERCLERWPQDAGVHFLLARTCRRLGDMPAARIQLRKAYVQDQPAGEVALEELLIQVQTNLAEAERAALDRLASVPPETPLIVEALIHGYLGSRILDKAYAIASHWMEAAPNDWYPRYLRGVVAAASRGGEQARMADAINDLKAVVNKKPNHPEAQLALAELFLYTGQGGAALPYSEGFLRWRREHGGAPAARARCQRTLGEGAAARSTLDDWLAAHPQVNDHDVFQIRGQLALDVGQLGQAKEWLTRSYTLAPKDPETLQLLAQVHRLRQESKEAEKYSQEKKACEEDIALVKKFTQELAQLGKAGSAREADAAKLADVYFNLGSALLRLDQPAPGLNSLRFALRFQPDHAGARRLLNVQALQRP